jgi:hypothetical protein
LPCPPIRKKVSTNVLTVACLYYRGQLAFLVLHSIGKFPRMSSQFPVPKTEDGWPALSSIPQESFHECPRSFLSLQQRTVGLPCPPFHMKVSTHVLTVSCPCNSGQLACLVLHYIEKFPRMSSQKVSTNILTVSCPYNRGQLACLVLHSIGKFPRMSSQFPVPRTEDN